MTVRDRFPPRGSIIVIILLLFAFLPPMVQGQNPHLDKLQQFWFDALNFVCGDAFATYDHQLLAKAAPDGGYVGIGNPLNEYNPVYHNLPFNPANGIPKVNQAYVWGMTQAGDKIWFGTVANTHALVLGAMFATLGLPLPPNETDSWVAELGQSQYELPPGVPRGDWRPPRIFTYDTQTNTTTEMTPADPLIQETAGIRAVGTLNDVIILGGPRDIFPGGIGGINLFAFNAVTGAYIGSTTLAQYNDIRKFTVVNGVLYAGVGRTAGGGSILRWNGTVLNPFQFEEVGTLDAIAAYLTHHNGRLYVTTWGVPGIFGGMSGLWMSPVIPAGGLTNAHTGAWLPVWRSDNYEPDPVTALTTVGGAVASYDGWVYWGTMHVPGMSTFAHFQSYGMPADIQDMLTAYFGTHRSIAIFRGRNFDTTPEIQLLYGMPMLPSYNPGTGQWDIVSNNMNSPPLFGLAGFGNFFNTYTWSMTEFNNELLVGTFDWSYLFLDMVEWIGAAFGLGIPNLDTIQNFLQNVPCFYGADLWRFGSSNLPALPESFQGVGNHFNYGIRNMLVDAAAAPNGAVYLGMANPMNLETDLSDNKPEGGWELIKLTKKQGNFVDNMLQYWLTRFSALCEESFAKYPRTRIAKAAADEDYVSPGNPANNWAPVYGNLPINPVSGVPKVNQGYVWGIEKSGDELWYGTVANMPALVIGTILNILGQQIPALQPQLQNLSIETASWVGEFNLNQQFGTDWRPPRIFKQDVQTLNLTEITPQLDPLINTTSGVRAVGILGDVVIFGGPVVLVPGGQGIGGINLFAYNRQTGAYLGSTTLPQYSDIRMFEVVNGVLYAGVEVTGGGGAVLRWTGDLGNPFQFVVVGNLDANAAYIRHHVDSNGNDRLFVTTWSIPLPGIAFGVESGMYMSPPIPPGGLTSPAAIWTKVWKASDYEPDLLVASTTMGGALASYDGWVYWGTMHIPMGGLLAHILLRGLPGNPADGFMTFLGTHRPIAIFRGRNFGEPNEEIELLYGFHYMPAYILNNPANPQGGGHWEFVPNNLNNPIPQYGMAGFGNFFNTYTWSMEVYNNELFVGTFDWSYLLTDFMDWAVQLLQLQLPFPNINALGGFFQHIPCFHGADLWRFASSNHEAMHESLTGVGNHTNYGVRNMTTGVNNGAANGALYLGMANPMNLLTNPNDLMPEGGWEVIRIGNETQPPGIQVNLIQPSGGEYIMGGVPYEIQWTCNPAGVGTVTLLLSTDGGNTFPHEIVRGAPNNGSYIWNVPTWNFHKTVVLKIEVHGSYADDYSGRFTIDSTPPEVGMTSPRGGETWYHGGTYPITWIFATDNFLLRNFPISIHYSLDNWTSSKYYIIASDLANTGLYLWTVPQNLESAEKGYATDVEMQSNQWGAMKNGSNDDMTLLDIPIAVNGTKVYLKVRAIDMAGNVGCGHTGGAVVVQQKPSPVLLTSPNGGEYLQGGTDYTIRWISDLPTATVDLVFSLDGGETYPHEIVTGETNDGEYTWTVPSLNTQTLRVKIETKGAFDEQDMSDADVTVDDTPPVVTLTTPTPGEMLEAGALCTIGWTATDNYGLTDAPIKLLVSLDGGATYPRVIAEAEANDSKYVWNVPPDLSSQEVRIKVEAMDRAGLVGSSSNGGNLTIQPSGLALISPVGGEIWRGGTIHPVTWTSNLETGTISLSYSTDGGDSFPHMIAENEANDGSYDWTLPELNNANIRLKLHLHSAQDRESMTRLDFTIDSEYPELTLCTLNRPDSLEAGGIFEIRWIAQDNLGLTETPIDIVCSIDGGRTYPLVIAKGEPNDSTFSWTTPTDLYSKKVKIKLDVTDRAGHTRSICSASSFTVMSPYITITSPNGGEVWEGMTTQTIQWQSNFNSGLVTLKYSMDGGLSYPNLIARGLDNRLRSYEWEVPQINQTRVLVAAELQMQNLVQDLSDQNFEIQHHAPEVTIIYPNGGEIWEANSVNKIEWTAKDDYFDLVTDPITIRYSTDGGKTFPYTVATRQVNNSTFVWKTPSDLNSPNVRLKVEALNVRDVAGYDTNDEVMGILNPPPVVTDLPDSSFDNSGALYFSLDSYVQDKNDDLVTLMWSAYSTEPAVEVFVNNDNKWCTILARNWIGEADVVLTVTDPFGDTDSDTMRVVVTGQTAVNHTHVSAVPEKFVLHQNFPNPFNPETTISFGLPKASEVIISVYDMNGKKVTDLFEGRKDSGIHTLRWNALDCPSGVYFIKMQASSFLQMRKCILMK